MSNTQVTYNTKFIKNNMNKRLALKEPTKPLDMSDIPADRKKKH